jgi:flagella basal body P-ring formation protein FlgA
MLFKVLWLGTMLLTACPCIAKDLWLKPKYLAPEGFLRLAQLVENDSEAPVYENVFLGRAPSEKTEQITLEFIRARLRREGFITVVPKLRNNELSIHVSPLKQQVLGELPAPKVNLQPLVASSTSDSQAKEYTYLALKSSESRGTLLTPDLVEPTQERRLIPEAFTSPEDLIGYRLERSLAKGSILTQKLVSIPPVIERGATIKVIMRAPGIEISGIAKTLGEGKVGDIIEVRRQNETLKGTIIDPHTVLIQ